MPVCINDPKKNYTGEEPSPKGLGYCAHGEKEGQIRKGRDGNNWIIKKVVNGSLRWVKGVKINNIQDPYVFDCSRFVSYMKTKKSYIKRRPGAIVGLLEGIKSKKKGYIHKFVSYNNFEKEETKIPIGYKKYKIDNVKINNYYCGNKIILTKQIVPKINHPGFKHYFTYNTPQHGKNPYLVYVGKSDVYIYKIDKKYFIDLWDINPEKWMYTELVKNYKHVVKKFIGKSQLNSMTENSGEYGKEYDGNSIVLQLSTNKYAFIGIYIYEFTLQDNIAKYYSPIGNIPYPVLLGDKNVYFMIEKTYVERKYFSNTDWSDSYTNYYGHGEYNSLIDKSHKIKNIKIIHPGI